MKQARYSPYNKLVFREPFNSKQGIRKNGGVPTAVTVAKGIGSFNGTSSYIDYNLFFKGVFSIRIKLKEFVIGTSNTHIFDFVGTGVGNIAVGTTGTLTVSSGTRYVGGVASSSCPAGDREIVVSGISLDLIRFYLGSWKGLVSGHWLNSKMDLFEIYEGTLTASEVKNLYDNKWAKELAGLGGQGGSDIPRIFTASLGTPTINGDTITFTTGENQAVRHLNYWTIGKKYRVSATVTDYTGTGYIILPYGSAGIQLITADGTYVYNIVADSVNMQMYSPSANGGTITVNFIQELQPELLLDFDSSMGVLEDRTGKNVLTPTDVSIKKTGSYYSAEFNGSTSMINTGSDFIGPKAITVAGWINIQRENVVQGIISNSSTTGVGFQLVTSGSGNKLGFYVGNVLLYTADDVYEQNKPLFLAITLKSDGKLTYYAGYKDKAPEVSGSIDQQGGTITVGLHNVYIGVRGTSYFKGQIKNLRVYEDILDLDQLTQIWSSTRGKIQ